MRSAIVFLGVVIGESVPRFDIVMALIGGSLTGPLVFVLPPLMYSKAVALKARYIRMSTPEIYSGSERRASTGSVSIDPKIHSRSIYYGILGVTKTHPHRYSYIYYDDSSDEYDTSSDYADREGDTSSKQELNEFLMRRSREKPVFLDASRPYRTRRRAEGLLPESTPSTKLRCNFQEVNNWMGYLIVLFGIVITLSSTYINIKNTIRYVRFTPPCIVNASVVQNPL